MEEIFEEIGRIGIGIYRTLRERFEREGADSWYCVCICICYMRIIFKGLKVSSLDSLRERMLWVFYSGVI